MEVLELAGYTEEEKLSIARDHLVQKQIKNHGLTPEQLTITDAAVANVIRGYTREAGVRNLEREIGALCRKAARRRAEGNEAPVIITPDVVFELLGAPSFLDEEMEERTKEPGVAIGLAWTPAGGDVLFIEASRMAGTGSLTLTGQLGDVMKESARAALSWFRAHAATYGADPDFFKNAEIHLHVPSGAIPKDGPSAGVTIATALASELTRRPVRGDIAMTGEITLSGRVLPVGGIKEKVLAARRVGIREVIMPRQNEKNVNEDLSPELRKELTIHFVQSVDEVLLLGAVTGAEDHGTQEDRAPRSESRPVKRGDGFHVDDLAALHHGPDLGNAERLRLDILILIGLGGGIAVARRPQAGQPVEIHFFIAVSGRRKKRSELFHARGNQADLLLAFARGGFLRVLSMLEASGRQLPHPAPDRVTVLANEDDAAVAGDGHEHDRAGMANDLGVEPAALRQRDRFDLHGEDPAFEHLANLLRHDWFIHRLIRRPSIRECPRARR